MEVIYSMYMYECGMFYWFDYLSLGCIVVLDSLICYIEIFFMGVVENLKFGEYNVEIFLELFGFFEEEVG